jgi:hypothetical protein
MKFLKIAKYVWMDYKRFEDLLKEQKIWLNWTYFWNVELIEFSVLIERIGTGYIDWEAKSDI